MKTTVYVIRHGETEWNLRGRFQGHFDSSLTERGISQASRLGQHLAGRSISAIYSSDLGRAMATAEIISRSIGLPVQSVDKLRERRLGCLEGLTKDEAATQFPMDLACYESGSPDECISGGESFRNLLDRTEAFLVSIAHTHRGESVAVVTHGGNLNATFRMVVGLPMDQARRFSLLNGSLAHLQFQDETWKLIRWGWTAW
ncbi:MAG: histidine phosphatase family protein [Dechloromonas sp.]|nr:MAG: histidine phosphatase family protein [Dechloromonas sp.]